MKKYPIDMIKEEEDKLTLKMLKGLAIRCQSRNGELQKITEENRKECLFKRIGICKYSGETISYDDKGAHVECTYRPFQYSRRIRRSSSGEGWYAATVLGGCII